MDAQISSTVNREQDQGLSSELNQSTDSPSLVIGDVFSLDKVDQLAVHYDVLNKVTVDPVKHLPPCPEARSSMDRDTGSETEDEFFNCIVCGEGFSEMSNLLTHTLEHKEQSNESAVLDESEKENAENISNTSQLPGRIFDENVEVVDLTDDGNTDGQERTVFGDLANISQSLNVCTEGSPADIPERMTSNVNQSWGTGIANHLMVSENDPRNTAIQSEEPCLRPHPGHWSQGVIDLTGEQEHLTETTSQGIGHWSSVVPQSENNGMFGVCLTRLESDMEVHSKETPFACGVCGKGFKSSAAVSSHMTVHSENRPHICVICGHGFKQKQALQTHMSVHSEERPHKCSVCGQGFKKKWNMISHKALLHSPRPSEFATGGVVNGNLGTDQYFTCSVCGKSCKGQRGISRHMAVHDEENLYACPLCGKKFKSHQRMDAHMAYHTGEMPYICQICGRGFQANAHLQNHMVTHTDTRSFECVICRKCCKTKTALASHIRSHTVKQP